MEQHQNDLKAVGLQTIAIAMGDPKHIDRYCGRIAPTITCLTGDDGGQKAYYAYGLQEGTMKQLASLGVLAATARAFSRGSVGGRIIGNAKMMPGSFIVDRAGNVVWTHYNEHIGDHPSFDKILEVARQLKDN